MWMASGLSATYFIDERATFDLSLLRIKTCWVRKKQSVSRLIRMV